MRNGAGDFTAERIAELRENIDFSDIPEIAVFSGRRSASQAGGKEIRAFPD